MIIYIHGKLSSIELLYFVKKRVTISKLSSSIKTNAVVYLYQGSANCGPRSVNLRPASM